MHPLHAAARNAGTDAGIWIDIIGDRGTSGRQALIDTNKDTFERGQARNGTGEGAELGHGYMALFRPPTLVPAHNRSAQRCRQR